MIDMYIFRIIEKNNGKPPLTYHQFQAIISAMDPPPQPEPTITDETIGKARSPIHEGKIIQPYINSKFLKPHKMFKKILLNFMLRHVFQFLKLRY